MGNLSCALTCVVMIACAGEARIDPADLELRDLLGVAPEVAVRWDAAQRTAARRVLAAGFRAPGEPHTSVMSDGDSLDDRVIRTLAALDATRAADGGDALGVVELAVEAHALIAVGRDAETAAQVAQGGPGPRTELWLDEAWDTHAWGYLPGRGRDVLSAIAVDAGHVSGPVIVAPASRLAVIAGYVAASEGAPARLVVNPIVLAAIEPAADEASTAAALTRPMAVAPSPHLLPVTTVVTAAMVAPSTSTAPRAEAPSVAAAGPAAGAAAGNPYSFYGSVAECAFAQRTRCETCVAAGDCAAVTDTSDGLGECARLGEDEGRGYFLLCINLALAIRSVDACTADAAPSCARSTTAANSLATLEANAGFLDNPVCGGPLDGCLAKIYGEPPGEFPGVDGGVTAPVPPRDTTIDCGDSCSNNGNNNTCSGPSADCSGPSCNNSLSCDSTCSSSNDQSGCGGTCDSCESSDAGGSSDGGGCGGDDSSSSSDGCGGGEGGGGDSCGGDSCGGDSCNNDSCGGGGGGNGCNVARQAPSRGAALMISMMWALLPVPAAALARRRSRRRRRAATDGLAAVPDDPGAPACAPATEVPSATEGSTATTRARTTAVTGARTTAPPRAAPEAL